MNHNIFILGSLFAASALLGLPFAAHADNGKILYTANTKGAAIKFFGSTKKENYDVAIRLADKKAIGKKIVSINMPFYGSENISDVKFWITKKLELDETTSPKVNKPDVLSVDATFSDSIATATLPTPYTIDSDTLYIGCTFTVPELDKKTKTPLILVKRQMDQGFWLHSSRTYRSWMSKAESSGTATIEVMLEGANANEASFDNIPNAYSEINKTTDLTLTARNYGYNGIKSIDYSYTIDGKKHSGHLDLAEPVEAYFGTTTSFDVTLDAIATKGKYPLELTVDKVNGEDNSGKATGSGQLTVYTKMPKHNSVMEEYTGTWCGWCPRGFVGLEVMNRLHPDFIALSYHNADPMEVMTSEQFPSDVSGFPSAVFNRDGKTVDPYYGNDDDEMGIETIWKEANATLAPAAMDTKGAFADGGKKIKAKAYLCFPEDRNDADKYKVEFVIVADSLHGEGSLWQQHNYYTPENKAALPVPEAEPFFQGNNLVNGLDFNFVVLATTRLTDFGLAPVPANVKEDATIEIEGEFLVDSILSVQKVKQEGGKYVYYKDPVIQDLKNLRIVALLLNEDGSVANAAKGSIYESEATAIRNVDDSNAVDFDNTSTVIYNLQGHRLQTMQKGLNIVRTKDGRARKVIVK